MNLKFGTSGVRGLVSDLTPAATQGFVKAFLQYAQTHMKFSQVGLARDLRESSPGLAFYAQQAIESLGLKVLDCGEVSTPNLAFFCQSKQIPGIMITGSHIPADRNGLKFYFPNGEILKKDEAEILKRFQEIYEKNPAPATAQSEASQLFLSRYLSFFEEFKPLFKGQHVIVFQHSSVGRDFWMDLLASLGFEPFAIERSSIFTPVDTEAPSEEEKYRGWIRDHEQKHKQKVLAIISTDGDGDRPFVCNEKGQQVRGDVLGILTSQFLKIATIATPISSTTAIEKMNCFQVIRTKIGSPFVIEAMETAKNLPVAGFEANGGFILGSPIQSKTGRTLDKLPTRDSVLPILASLTLALQKSLSLSQLAETLPLRFTTSDLIRNFPLEKLSEINSQLQKTQWIQDLFGPIADTNNLDGLRYTLKSGNIIHFRPSGNAPEFRIYSEADSLQEALKLAEIGKKQILSLLK